jgi:hypothetical protein
MINKCECKQDPAGTWDYKDLIGSAVKVKSMPVTNFIAIDSEEVFTIDDIYFRVSLDGKIITIVKLKELPGSFFTLRDLELVGISRKSNKIVGEFTVAACDDNTENNN